MVKTDNCLLLSILRIYILFFFTTVIHPLCQRTMTWTIDIAKHFTSKWPISREKMHFSTLTSSLNAFKMSLFWKIKPKPTRAPGQAASCLQCPVGGGWAPGLRLQGWVRIGCRVGGAAMSPPPTPRCPIARLPPPPPLGLELRVPTSAGGCPSSANREHRDKAGRSRNAACPADLLRPRPADLHRPS